MKLSRWQTRRGNLKAFGLMMRGLVLTAGGEVESAVHQITSALAAHRSTGGVEGAFCGGYWLRGWETRV